MILGSCAYFSTARLSCGWTCIDGVQNRRMGILRTRHPLLVSDLHWRLQELYKLMRALSRNLIAVLGFLWLFGVISSHVAGDVGRLGDAWIKRRSVAPNWASFTLDKIVLVTVTFSEKFVSPPTTSWAETRMKALLQWIVIRRIVFFFTSSSIAL